MDLLLLSFFISYCYHRKVQSFWNVDIVLYYFKLSDFVTTSNTTQHFETGSNLKIVKLKYYFDTVFAKVISLIQSLSP